MCHVYQHVNVFFKQVDLYAKYYNLVTVYNHIIMHNIIIIALCIFAILYIIFDRI